MARLLIIHGANVNAKRKNGLTPLHHWRPTLVDIVMEVNTEKAAKGKL